MASAIFVNTFLSIFGIALLCGYSIALTETRKMLNPLIITIVCAIVVYNSYLAWLNWH